MQRWRSWAATAPPPLVWYEGIRTASQQLIVGGLDLDLELLWVVYAPGAGGSCKRVVAAFWL
jgi:hypothetical protein